MQLDLDELEDRAKWDRQLPRAPRERAAEAHAVRAAVLLALGQTRDAAEATASARSLAAEDATPAWTAALVRELVPDG